MFETYPGYFNLDVSKALHLDWFWAPSPTPLPWSPYPSAQNPLVGFAQTLPVLSLPQWGSSRQYRDDHDPGRILWLSRRTGAIFMDHGLLTMRSRWINHTSLQVNFKNMLFPKILHQASDFQNVKSQLRTCKAFLGFTFFLFSCANNALGFPMSPLITRLGTWCWSKLHAVAIRDFSLKSTPTMVNGYVSKTCWGRLEMNWDHPPSIVDTVLVWFLGGFHAMGYNHHCNSG